MIVTPDAEDEELVELDEEEVVDLDEEPEPEVDTKKSAKKGGRHKKTSDADEEGTLPMFVQMNGKGK